MRSIRYSLLILVAVVCLFPFYWMIVTAISSTPWISSPKFFPIPPTIAAFRVILTNHPFLRWTLNTFIVTTIGTCGGIFFACLAAFSFGCLAFKGKDFIFWVLFFSTMVMPGFLMLIPRFFLVAKIGAMNSYVGVFLLWWFQMFSVFLLRQHFLTISRNYLDAARMDGANLWRIFWNVVMPMSKGVIFALFVIVFLKNWNQLMWPMVILRSTNMQTLTVGMSDFYDIYQADFAKIMAGAIISLTPIIILFIALQKYVEHGISLRFRI